MHRPLSLHAWLQTAVSVLSFLFTFFLHYEYIFFYQIYTRQILWFLFNQPYRHCIPGILSSFPNVPLLFQCLSISCIWSPSSCKSLSCFRPLTSMSYGHILWHLAIVLVYGISVAHSFLSFSGVMLDCRSFIV